MPNEYHIISNPTLRNIKTAIRKMASLGAENIRIKELAQQFQKKEYPVKSAFHYVSSHVAFRNTPDDLQRLQTPSVTLDRQYGNCADYAILLSSILTNMKVPHVLSAVSTEKRNKFDHTYISTNKGTVLDPTIGQLQDGSDKIGENKGCYNCQGAYIKKKISKWVN